LFSLSIQSRSNMPDNFAASPDFWARVAAHCSPPELESLSEVSTAARRAVKKAMLGQDNARLLVALIAAVLQADAVLANAAPGGASDPPLAEQDAASDLLAAHGFEEHWPQPREDQPEFDDPIEFRARVPLPLLPGGHVELSWGRWPVGGLLSIALGDGEEVCGLLQYRHDGSLRALDLLEDFHREFALLPSGLLLSVSACFLTAAVAAAVTK